MINKKQKEKKIQPIFFACRNKICRGIGKAGMEIFHWTCMNEDFIILKRDERVGDE